jgi:hypothetical protein
MEKNRQVAKDAKKKNSVSSAWHPWCLGSSIQNHAKHFPRIPSATGAWRRTASDMMASGRFIGRRIATIA